MVARSRAGLPETVEILLKYGADPNRCSGNREFPLEVASTSKVREILFKHGASQEIIDNARKSLHK